MIDRFEDWKHRADQCDLHETAVRYGAVLKRAGREWIGPCPHCGGRDRFSVNQQRHKWFCRGHGGGHGAISMTMHLAGLSFLGACESLTGEPSPSGAKAKPLSEEEKAARNRARLEAEARQRAREAEEQAYQDDTREAAQAIWDASQPIVDTVAETYLRSRGLGMDEYPGVLRFHPALPYPGKTMRYPVLVARVDDVTGNLTAIWRIFLREDGRKADVENPKLGLGPSAGGAVRLFGIASHVGIAEGVETALAARLLTGGKIPVWSGLSTAVSNVEIPLGVSRVTIFPDGDRPIKRHEGDFIPAVPPGRKAARTLFARLTEEGVRAAVAAEPPPGRDYNDLWLDMLRESA